MPVRRASVFRIALFIAATVITLTIVLGFSIQSVPVAAQNAAVRIMPLGDSITTHSGSRNSYRRPLWHRLDDAGYNVDFVGSREVNDYNLYPANPDFDLNHEGHPGWRVDNILGNIRYWASAYRPDIVLIHLGTNDLLQGQSVDSTISELNQLIDILRASNPNVTILLAKIIPFERTHSERIPALNTGIANLAASKNTAQSPVILVDQHSGFNVATDTLDSVHPNAAGERKLANRWFQALRTVLGETPPPPTATPRPTQAPTERPPQGRNGLTGRYFNRPNLTALRHTRVDSTINFFWDTGAPAPRVGAETFSVRWTGDVVPRYSETYTFYTYSDDGVRLWVNGQRIINNWTNHGPTEDRGRIRLVAGRRYRIRLEYYDRDNNATITLSWSSASQRKEIIPANRLFASGG